MIHDTAIIYPDVKIGDNVIVEPFAILGIQDRFHDKAGLIINNNSFIGSRCTIYTGVECGEGLDISDQTTIFTQVKIGKNCRIGPKAIIKNGCIIGDNVRINATVFMERVTVGSNVFIGPGVTFTDDMHPPCTRYKECVGATIVESFVSIGANCVFAPGVKIGHHSQIYAGSVVISDVEPYSVIAGVPGRKVKDFRELTCSIKAFSHPFEHWDASLKK